MTLAWHNWIGLPHWLGADPRDRYGACCLRMAYALHEAAGTPMPPFQAEWLVMARDGKWNDLEAAFHSITSPIEGPRLWSLIPITGHKKFGIGVVVQDQMMLTPHHQRGVMAIPLRCVPDATFHWPNASI
jgi:hypothetical protein